MLKGCRSLEERWYCRPITGNDIWKRGGGMNEEVNEVRRREYNKHIQSFKNLTDEFTKQG